MAEGMTALLWGLFAGSALLFGASIGYWLNVPQRLIAAVMAYGSGVLISALSFELMEEAYLQGGLDAAGGGCLAGAAVYTAANVVLTRFGAKHRKRSGHQQAEAGGAGGSGAAIAIGALLDGIPESIVIGVSLLEGGTVSRVTVAAIFLSNFPEGLSSSSGMRNSGRSATYVFCIWGGIAASCGLAALAGFTLFEGLPPHVIAATTAVAAGAILAMLSDTMIPEAFETTHEFTGFIAVAGFLTAFVLSRLGGTV
jgi:ZIP family zinc transporter